MSQRRALRWCGGLGLAWLGCAALAQGRLPVSESDFLADMPVVLSVSRLSQRLDETPGAVTVLDREMIRRSGARDVADVLRLVPGFQSTNSFETDAPQVSYHGGFSEYSNRLQVLVDGRSVYSPYLIGTIGLGLQTVAVQDIDHIEVLRGSNSASYGARAFLGVVNIVTLDPFATRGAVGRVSIGQSGVRDVQTSLGWGNELAIFRLTADQRGDDGLIGSNGGSRMNRVNFRADLHASPRDEFEFRAGGLDLNTGVGFVDRLDRAAHDRVSRSSYVQFDWRRTLSADEDFAVQYSRANETYVDAYSLSLGAFGFDGDVLISASGGAKNDSLSAQYTRRVTPNFRWVAGGELRREEVASRALYGTYEPFVTRFVRVFGNAEWRLSSSLLLNAGALAEHSDVVNGNLAPRVMLNWHASETETWRVGVSKAFRPPSTFERSANVSYELGSIALQTVTLPTGRVGAENIIASEIGYLATLPAWSADLDVRLFHERLFGFVRRQRYALLTGTTVFPSNPADYLNNEDFSIQGIEMQLKWRPWSGAEMRLTEALTTDLSRDEGTSMAAPRLAQTFVFSQKFARGLDLSLIQQNASPATLQGTSKAFGIARTDVRLAMPVNFGAVKGSVALVVQNLGPPNRDFDLPFSFGRRAFVTLTLDN